MYEYDPATNIYTKWHDFHQSTGYYPSERLVAFGGKLYGTAYGSTNSLGNIFEYDPVTHAYAEKVVFGAGMGSYPHAGLTLYNNKLYGVTTGGGNNDDGVLFEYNPLPNSFLVKAHFDSQTTGYEALGNMVVYNNKLYGVTLSSYTYTMGVIYEFNPANDSLVHKFSLTQTGGKYARSGMTLLNNKLYGLTSIGGTISLGGTMFEFDPAVNSYTAKIYFEGLNGRLAGSSELTPIPAPVAPGSPGSCTNTQTININAANANEWIAFTDNQGRAVAEINANGNILGNTAVRCFINGGNMRMDASGTFYLDRNITITPTNQPVTPVSIRLYIQKSEFESIQATQGSGVSIPSDMVIYRNSDFCAANLTATLTQLYTTQSNWSVDYVYTAETSALGSFYFAAGINTPLPVHILSFTGEKHKDYNELNWQAACSNNVRFDLQRSEDGSNFKMITSIAVNVQDCNAPFVYKDEQFTEGNNYYRLLMEDNGSTTYSNIVLLQRDGLLDTDLKIVPNPVTRSIADIYIRSSHQKTIHLTITDLTGKIISALEIQAGQGVSQYPVDMSDIASGIYYARYYDGEKMRALKFVKQ
ncbi:MAG: T9SS type A sorting domain-containing protein [Taibaiella sp.]